MKGFKKRFSIAFLLLVAMFLLFPSIGFAKSDSASVKVNGNNLYGSLTVGKDYASATTTANKQLSMTVNLTYTYGIAGTTSKKTISRSAQGFKRDVSARLTPVEYGSISVSAVGSHSWVVDGNKWNRATSIVY